MQQPDISKLVLSVNKNNINKCEQKAIEKERAKVVTQ